MKELSNVELIELYKKVDEFIKYLEYNQVKKD